jgi:hypothetical protein
MQHRYNLGQLVRFSRGFRSAAGGDYEVCRQLPDSDGELQYRIRSDREPHERVARESELHDPADGGG